MIARGEDPATERKLIQAGADRVVLPAHIGAERISHLIPFPEASELIDDAEKSNNFQYELGDLGLKLGETVIPQYSPFIGKTLAELEASNAGSLIVVAIHSKEKITNLNPAPSTVLRRGDGIVAVSHSKDLSTLLAADRS